jgi:endonuclease III
MARRPYNGPNKRQKFEYKCAICGEWFKAADVVVDHFPKAAGSILSLDDVGEFCNNLYCEVGNLRVLCVDDHDIYTLQQKNPDMTFEEARFEKQLNNLMRKENREKLVALLNEHGYNCKNDVQRREALTAILMDCPKILKESNDG